MDLIQEFFRNVYNVQMVVELGVWVLVAIIFAETGLMIGFFLPGDSLLVTAGIFAAAGGLNILELNLLLIIAAIAGDATGYWIGKRTGQALYSRPNSLLFRREHLIKTHEFYEKHGGKTIVIARFMPIVRTFAPVVAGAAQMTYRSFAVYNIMGGALWVTSMTLGGYFLGRMIPNIGQHIHKVVAVVIFVSLLPAAFEFLRAYLKSRKAAAGAPAATDPAPKPEPAPEV